MITIRNYSVGKLIADTYSEFNLSFVPPEELGSFLGPFQYAKSKEKAHQEAIAKVIKSAIVLVAEDDGEIIGVLRGRRIRLGSLFVRGDYHRRGIGRKLVEHFELECIRQGPTVIRVASTLYAVPFYLAMGYKKSTGVRTGWSFDGRGLKIQPMRKVLGKA
jgi:GNAT superfamily N-acetyltransferase